VSKCSIADEISQEVIAQEQEQMNLMNLMAPDRGVSVVVVREFQHALYRGPAMIAKRRNVGSRISNGCYAGTFGGADIRLPRRPRDLLSSFDRCFSCSRSTKQIPCAAVSVRV